MQHESNNTPESSAETTQHSRRKFLTRATAGVVIASLPAKSVWAAGGNILNSIVASGHGSDFAGGKRVQLLSAADVKAKITGLANIEFNSTFGGAPFAETGALGATVNANRTFSLLDVLNGNGKSAGANNVNMHMVALFIAARITKNGNTLGVYYPVVRTGGFGTAEDFAKHLYTSVRLGAIDGLKLNQIIECYKIGSTGTGSCGIL